MKSGSASTPKEFRRLVGNICREDTMYHHMPDYSVVLDEDDMVVFRNREVIDSEKEVKRFKLRPETYEDARIVAPGWDAYNLEQEWRGWISELPRDPDAAFIGFCRKWFERRGRPA